jgi:hypothetical protein
LDDTGLAQSPTHKLVLNVVNVINHFGSAVPDPNLLVEALFDDDKDVLINRLLRDLATGTTG